MNRLTMAPQYAPRGIPEEVLEGWSSQGAVTTAKATHERIRRIISSINWGSIRTPQVYLQGSYLNDTNIRGDSDVDVVVELILAKPLLYKTIDDINWFLEYRHAIYMALAEVLPNVQPDKKCIKIPRTANTIPADVVPAFFHQESQNYPLPFMLVPPSTGMKFFVREENRWVINYPKMHSSNGTMKHQATNGWYKPIVRVFKNALSYMDIEAPGYFLECLLYNVPDHVYLYGPPNYRTRFVAVQNWLYQAGMNYFTCQNGQLSLFGSSPEQWSEVEARRIVGALGYLWNNF